MITSPQNSRIKQARNLQRKRYRTATSQLLIEGVRLVGDAIDSNVEPDVLFYVPELLDQNSKGQILLQKVQQLGVPCEPCTGSVFNTLSTTITPQGIAAVVPLPAIPSPLPLTFLLILDGVRDPGNAGTLLRSAEAAGVEAVFFGPETVDPYNDKVLRAAMGTHFRLPIQTYSLWEDLRADLPQDLVGYLCTANALQPYDTVQWAAPSAIVIGGEANGPSDAAHAWGTPISIPMTSAIESLNAAMAGTIVMFEAARQRRQGKHENKKKE